MLLLLIGFIVYWIVWAVIWFIFSSGMGVSDGIADYLVEQVLALLSVPVTAAVGTVIYLDLRVRKESLSTDELASTLSEQGYRWENRSDVSGPVDAPTGDPADPAQGPQRRRGMKRTTAVTLALLAFILIATVA